jgi:hypothetical protein
MAEKVKEIIFHKKKKNNRVKIFLLGYRKYQNKGIHVVGQKVTILNKKFHFKNKNREQEGKPDPVCGFGTSGRRGGY